jgi:hypothetical protein
VSRRSETLDFSLAALCLLTHLGCRPRKAKEGWTKMRKVKQIFKQNGRIYTRHSRRRNNFECNFGAGDGTRTRDSLLGRLPRDKLAIAW